MKNYTELHIVYISLGSNQNNPKLQIQKANEVIEDLIGKIKMASDLYETKAWGHSDQPNFMNQVIKVETNLPPILLMRKLLKIEKELGRIRKEKWGPRIIDLDLLFYDDLILNSKLLKLPHPRLHERKFVLVPLLELNPFYFHPIFRQTIRELLGWCQDDLEVKRLKN